MGRKPNFKFHSNCERLKIVNLSFADDLIVFTRGDSKSIHLAVNTMHDFAESTSLNVKPLKCHAYFGNVESEVKREILRATNFKEGILPFRYLGIPLNSGKITINNCLPLVDLIVRRIRHWSSGLLSMAERIQLVKSVLFAVIFFGYNAFLFLNMLLGGLRRFVGPSCGLVQIGLRGNLLSRGTRCALPVTREA